MIKINCAKDEEKFAKRGQALLDLLQEVLRAIENSPGGMVAGEYRAYLHGQAYGLAVALKAVFPGPGELGEQAALISRPAITEFKCDCRD